ncbi:MAG: AMP-binding enzyme, partial [Parvibaculales bacterium]
HDSVEDALGGGGPDENGGQAVTAGVNAVSDAAFDEEELKQFCKTKLAAYKTPKHVFNGGPPFRAPNGKADYKSVTNFAVDEVAKRA